MWHHPPKKIIDYLLIQFLPMILLYCINQAKGREWTEVRKQTYVGPFTQEGLLICFQFGPTPDNADMSIYRGFVVNISFYFSGMMSKSIISGTSGRHMLSFVRSWQTFQQHYCLSSHQGCVRLNFFPSSLIIRVSLKPLASFVEKQLIQLLFRFKEYHVVVEL